MTIEWSKDFTAKDNQSDSGIKAKGTPMKEVELFLSRSTRAVLIVAACCLVISCQTFPNARESGQPFSQANANSTEWLTSAEYQKTLNKKVKDGFYPSRVEGRCDNDYEQFRAEWKGIPLGTRFFSHHGLTKESYETRNQEYISKGYSLISITTFRDCSGTERYQATWFKKAK